MEARHRQAFDKLRIKGIDVRESESEDYGIFWINCETDSIETELALEYYDNYWGSDFLNDTLEKHGLFFEWHSPAYATITEL